MSLAAHLNWIEVVFTLVALGYLVSGLDDLVIDIFYWLRRLIKGQPFTAVRLSELVELEEKRIAVFIPAWMESDIIEEMLLYNEKVIQYENYDFFIGTYPNDEATQAGVDAAADVLPNVIQCVGQQAGPTTKADNLNGMLRAMERREAETGQLYDFVVLHDPEDVLHPYEFKLLNYHMSRRTADMIQLPILPLTSPRSAFTSATYMDQFAENQTKDMHVRGWVGGFVPSCGVATAIARSAIETLREDGEGDVFDVKSLTEDYEVGLRLALAGKKALFIRQRLIHDLPAEEPEIAENVRKDDWVATRSEFPATFSQAVRQRTRWSLGIVFQSWKYHGWNGRAADRWLLAHDRKGAVTYPILAVGYLFVAAVGLASAIRYVVYPELPPLLQVDGWIAWLVAVVTALMMNRLLQRAVAVARIYGPAHACLSVVRQPWDNLLSLSATVRAALQFARSEYRGRAVAWDKTPHTAVPELVKEARARAEQVPANPYVHHAIYSEQSNES